MQNIFANKTNLFYLAAASILVIIVIVIVVVLSLPQSSSKTTLFTPTPVLTPTKGPVPLLRETISPQKQGEFTVSFPKAPDPNIFTITLASSTTDPSSPTKPVTFSQSFRNDGKLLVITSKDPLIDNAIYTLYVRLKTNNHVVVKHRYLNQKGKLTIIDTD
jgi:hypothetical protein